MIDSSWLAVTGVLVVLGAAWLWVTRELSDRQWADRENLRTWGQAAVSLGMRPSCDQAGKHMLRATSGALEVQLSEAHGVTSNGSLVPYVRIEVFGEDIGWLLALADRSSAQSSFEAFHSRSPNTGDAAFDECARVWDEQVCSLAALDESTRNLLLGLMRQGAFAVQRKRLCLILRGAMGELEASLKQTIEDCLKAARRLSRSPADALEALTLSAETDLNPAVRLRSLEVLAQRFPGTAVGQRAAQALLSAEDPKVRLSAAMTLEGAAGYECLVKLVSGERWVPGGLRARALRQLVDAYPEADQSGLIAYALDSHLEPLQLVAAEVAARAPHDARFAAALSQDTDASRTLSRATSTALVEMLSYGPIDSQLAAACALGRVGTLECVESLLPWAKGLAPRQGLRRAATEAIRELQARLGSGGTAGGGLTVVEPEERQGALSLSPPNAREERHAAP
jgi:hypothetical protein